jgi:hypothetical protein
MCSTTQGIESAVVERYALKRGGSRRLVLVDTPGFEADDLKDASTLRSINRWLSERCVRSASNPGKYTDHSPDIDKPPLCVGLFIFMTSVREVMPGQLAIFLASSPCWFEAFRSKVL